MLFGRSTLAILVTILAAQCAAQPPRVQPAGARGARLEGPIVRIPSKYAGAEGIWLRVAPPEKPRFADGAPVVVHVPVAGS